MPSVTGTFTSSNPTLTDGMARELALTADGALRVASSGGTGSTATTPTYERAVGSDNLSTSQAATSISPAASTLIVAARSGRRNVTLTNITGTQPVYFTATSVTTGVTTGLYLAGTAGASVTLAYTGAVYGTSPTAAQTISFAETY